MNQVVVGFANLGRGGLVETRNAVALITAEVLKFERAAVLFNEVDEADTADEHGMLSAAFRQWEDHAWRSREPIFTKGLRTKWSHSFKAARGVPHQSPARPVHEVLLDGGDDPDIALLGGHYPAGAHNGRRPARVKVLLVAEYARMLKVHRRRIRHHHRVGHHVVWAMDVNWRMFPRLHRAEGTVIKNGPDFIRVIPAPGYEAVCRRRGHVDLPVEPLHRFDWARIEFRPAPLEEVN